MSDQIIRRWSRVLGVSHLNTDQVFHLITKLFVAFIQKTNHHASYSVNTNFRSSASFFLPTFWILSPSHSGTHTR